MRTDQRIASMRDIEQRIELVISRFDSALYLEQCFINKKEEYQAFFDDVRLQKKHAQKELRNLRKRIATAQRNQCHEKI